jgi:hypothetical protein
MEAAWPSSSKGQGRRRREIRVLVEKGTGKRPFGR